MAFSQPPSTSTGLDRRGQRHGVEVGAQQDAVGARRPGIRASRLPASAPTARARVVLVDLEADARELARRPSPRTRARGPTGSRSGTARRTCRAAARARRRWRASPRGGGAATSPAAEPAAVRARRGTPRRRVRERRADELAEQRRRALGARLELGVVLRGDEERVLVGGSSIASTSRSSGRGARADQPGGLEPPAQMVVDLVAVAVALVDDRLAVELADPRRRRAA